MADNKDKKVLNVPALRFPEFNGEWITQPIKDIADFIGGGTPSSANEAYWQGTIPWVSSSDIAEDNINDITISRYITEEAISNSATKLCSAPVILIVSRVGVGKVALSNKAICTSQDFCNLINIKVHPTFLAYSLSQIMKRKSMEVQGTSIKGITSSEIQKIILRIPSLQEQHKISNLFQLIDKRIATQNKIIEKLETLIKGIVETVISSQKPNTLIKNCLECNLSTLQESQVAKTGTFPVYGATGISGYTETADINGESILIIKDGSGVGTVKFVTGKYSYIGTLNSLTVKDGYCLKYIYFALQRLSFEPYKTGMAIPHIYFKDYGKAKIFCPTIKEQFAIAKRISSIEDKVSVEKRILFYYQAQKSYLLSQMLI